MDPINLKGFCKLVDIDWQFGVIAASSEEKLVGKTYVCLKFTLIKENDMDNKERVHLELTVPQFYSLLHELEKARINLEC